MKNKETITHHIDHYEGHRYSHLNKRKYKDDADICIVGAGAAGGILAHELSKAGLKVVVIEAGPFWDPATDFVSDELKSTHLGWQETSIVGGGHPIQLGHNNTGRGVGGGTTHFTGVLLRYFESDFQTKTLDGVGEDWPLSYQDLAPYYDKVEKDIAVSGPKEFPWGPYRGPYPYPARSFISANSEKFRQGCEKLGIRTTVPPLGINSAPFDGRPPCINRGFCNQGCKPNAKFSTLVHHFPKAIGCGAEVITDSLVTQVLTNDQGKATGVTFVHDGQNYEQKAEVVILANFVVETPRLLMNSATAKFPDGLANSSGWVGKAIMVHSSNDVYAKFADEIRPYKGTPILATTREFYETDNKRDFARGYTLHAHGSRPVAMDKGFSKAGRKWGSELRKAMLDFNFYGQITLVGEVLPHPDNRVTLSAEREENGLPTPHVAFSYGVNDKRLIKHAVGKMKEIFEAAGGTPIFVTDDTAHLMGGCRMGDDPKSSVTDSYGRTHDIANLFICSASLFVTSGGGNPTNTIMAIAARTADYIKENYKDIVGG